MSLTNFYLITDTHFFKNDLGCYGKEYTAAQPKKANLTLKPQVVTNYMLYLKY